MRVLFAVAHLGKGGGLALQAYQLYTELRRHIDVQLVCLDSPGPHRGLSQEPGVVVAGPLVFPRGIVTLGQALRSFRGQYDLFQVLDPYFSFPAAYLARVFPRVVYLGQDPAWDIADRYGPAAGAIVRGILPLMLADGTVVANSNFLAGRLRRYSPRVIPNGVDIHKFENLPTREEARSLLGLPSDRTLIAFVGKVIPAKRVEWLLEVLRRLPDTDAVVLGDYTEEHYGDAYYRRLLTSYPDVRSRVTFTGEVSWDRVPAYLAAADVFVHSSMFEGQPNSVLEAMAAGLPAVVSDIPAHREIIEHGRTGFVAANPESMIQFVERLAGDPRLRREVGSSARACVQERYSSEACAKSFLELYGTILGS